MRAAVTRQHSTSLGEATNYGADQERRDRGIVCVSPQYSSVGKLRFRVALMGLCRGSKPVDPPVADKGVRVRVTAAARETTRRAHPSNTRGASPIRGSTCSRRATSSADRLVATALETLRSVISLDGLLLCPSMSVDSYLCPHATAAGKLITEAFSDADDDADELMARGNTCASLKHRPACGQSRMGWPAGQKA